MVFGLEYQKEVQLVSDVTKAALCGDDGKKIKFEFVENYDSHNALDTSINIITKVQVSSLIKEHIITFHIN